MSREQKRSLLLIAAAAVLLIGLHFVPVTGWLKLMLYLIPYLLVGGETLVDACKGIYNRQPFDENLLMAVATIGAMVLGDYPEAVSVMLFYQIGELFESYAVGRSRKNIGDLMDIRPDYANVETADGVAQVKPEQVAVGDTIVVKPGERVPLDGTVLTGTSALNMSALTGESAPVDVTEGSAVVSGSVNLSGVLRLRVEKVYAESTVARILELVENSSLKKAHTERFITKFARVYTPSVCGAALALAILPPVVRLIMGIPADWGEWVYRALTFLVISCPCALVISIPLSFFGGIGGASARGSLIKGSSYLEMLAKTDRVVFDKTGTLTNGAPALTDVCPCGTVQSETLVRLAAALEQCSDHPLARAVTAYAQQQSDAPLPQAEDFSYELGRGVRGTVAGAAVVCGSRTWLNELGIDTASLTALPDLRVQAKTELCVARDGIVLGTLGIADTRKTEAAAVVAQLKAAGKEVWMMTGDHARTAEAIAAEVGIDHALSEARPDEKAAAIERLRAQGKTVCMVGDGINDTPALAVADCAVAMGGGSDIAIESAGILLPSGNLEKLPELFDISRATIRTIRQNLTWALFYNLVSIPVAALGVLHPSICATAMSASSIGVLMHSLRLKDTGKKERCFPWKKRF